MRVAIVTNIPTPYRNPVYRILSGYKDIELHVFFCSISEPNRSWQNQDLDFNHSILSSQANSYIHSNFSIVRKLNKLDPEVVITSGFNPTMLFSWLWTVIKLKKHIPFTDAIIHSEKNLSRIHKLARSLIYSKSAAYLGASNKSEDLYKSYNVNENKIFLSCLATNNERFINDGKAEAEYDLLYCGQFKERKNPRFFVDIAVELNRKRPDLKVLLLGDGPLKSECISVLDSNNVIFKDAGFVQPKDLPRNYKSAKILIFPTKSDPWGLVANEALASGLPVLVSTFAGVANELVRDGFNGFVFDDFNISDWVLKIQQLLNNDQLYQKISKNAEHSISEYNFLNAAEGIYKASKYAAKVNS